MSWFDSKKAVLISSQSALAPTPAIVRPATNAHDHIHTYIYICVCVYVWVCVRERERFQM